MNEQVKASLSERVNIALNQLRPFLHADGGDMELAEITDDYIVRVKLIGSCSDCSMSHMTLRGGLEEALKQAAPEIKGVEAVQMA
jgi:Fe-S cluster biogenesis protein NfuA